MRQFDVLERIHMKELFEASGQALDSCFNDNEISSFAVLLNVLKEWNQKFNLTAIREDRDIIIKHFIDSLSIVKWIEKEKPKRILDIGTGAGFPGLPLKIHFPEIEFVLMDSTKKKLDFVKAAIERLNLEKIDGIWARAEEAYRTTPVLVSAFQVVVFRAVGSLRRLIHYAAPYLQPGGILIAMKGPSSDKDIQDSPHWLGRNWEVDTVDRFDLPFQMGKRVNIVIRKKKNG